jgi:hypothetical protein
MCVTAQWAAEEELLMLLVLLLAWSIVNNHIAAGQVCNSTVGSCTRAVAVINIAVGLEHC